MAISFRRQTLCCPNLQRGLSSVFFNWRSSLYKLCYKELIFFLFPYCILSIVYRSALNENGQRLFEQVVLYFEKYLKMISLPFLLGFYVTTVAARWWQQYMALPWPDRLSLAIAAYVPGTDDESRLIRQTLVRQCNLMAVLLLRGLSNSVSNRAKVLEDAVRAGCMTETEKVCFESIKSDINLYWLPGLWFTQNLQSAFKQGRIKDSCGAKLIMEEFLEFRGKCGVLWTYALINVPLIYTQVVTLASYSFFVACIIGRQRIVDPNLDEGFLSDIYCGVYTLLQFFFYFGLLKVAEQMINPYGTGDEHFDLDFLLDRHSKVIDLCTDTLSDQYPSAVPELLSQSVGYQSLEEELDSRKQKKTKGIIDRIFNSTVSGIRRLFVSSACCREQNETHNASWINGNSYHLNEYASPFTTSAKINSKTITSSTCTPVLTVYTLQ